MLVEILLAVGCLAALPALNDGSAATVGVQGVLIGSGKPLIGAVVEFEVRARDGVFVTLFSVTTAGDGRFSSACRQCRALADEAS